jgi:hypothetical protein
MPNETQLKQERENINNGYGLTERQYQYLITRFPFQVTNMSHSVGELQLNENNIRDFQNVCMALEIPSQLLNDSTASTYNNVESAQKYFWQSVILPEVRDLADDLINFLLPLFGETKEYHFKINTSQVNELQENADALTDRVLKQYNSGVINVNEARAMLNYDELELDESANQTQLNGEQISSLVTIMEQTSLGVIPLESAKELIHAAYPSIPIESIDAMINPIKVNPKTNIENGKN